MRRASLVDGWCDEPRETGASLSLVWRRANEPNASQFDRRLFRSRVVSIETNQICLTIFSLAVDKRTKNNLYMHWVSVFIIYSSIETFASTELTFGFDRIISFDRTDLIPMSRAGLANAITWKNLSSVSRDPGNAIPGSQLTGLAPLSGNREVDFYGV